MPEWVYYGVFQYHTGSCTQPHNYTQIAHPNDPSRLPFFRVFFGFSFVRSFMSSFFGGKADTRQSCFVSLLDSYMYDFDSSLLDSWLFLTTITTVPATHTDS